MPNRAVSFLMHTVLVATLLASAAQARVRPGIEVGVNRSSVTDSPVGAVGSFQTHWSAGVTLDVPLGKRLSFGTGVRYVEYGEGYNLALSHVLEDFSVEVSAIEVDNAWRYVAIPLRLRLRPNPDGGLYACAGPELGLLLESRAKTILLSNVLIDFVEPGLAGARPAGEIYEDVGTLGDQGDIRHYHRVHLALGGGVGYVFPFLGHEGSFEARYTHGLLDLHKSAALDRHVLGIEALMGLRW